MPLFECTGCGAIENTAISNYWSQQLDHFSPNNEFDPATFKPKCSECVTGTWHGHFPKRIAKDVGYVPDPKMPGFISPPGG